MKKNNVIKFDNFMDGSYKSGPSKSQKVIVHFKKNKKVYIRVGLMTASISLSVIHPAFAASGLGTGFDDLGYQIYRQLLSIGKWVIIVKGGWDVIRATLSNDYVKAKKDFISYLLAYVFLLILPEAMDYADRVVKHVKLAQG
ncbi:hypothetical protein HPT25_23305 [Bacillus sp. BRMEA1]|uniref:hypothetical protein n=1 Tax=Neobacillus endophyticus TaxID=2738405 RepID=UPI001563B204|nr:hypothetical protein [Neobacillus endophyticus]NRD80253.1 hypothetical protein [Neobacillus endophyticus]